MDSNFEVIKSIYENECQRIVECKEIKTGENYIYNIIYNPKLMKLIDANTLNSLKSNIVKCQKTQDRLYIVTKFHELNNQKLLKDYIDNNNLTLKQQFSLTQQLINLFIQIYSTTDLLQYKILNFKSLSVNEDNELFVNGYFEFKDEYDLSDNYSYKNIGKIIHYIFSKEEIVDYNISESIPPDVLKIIVKCLTKEYFHPKDTLKELENSPIYGLINCKTEPSLINKKVYEGENYEELKNKAKSADISEDKIEGLDNAEKIVKASSIKSEIPKDKPLNDDLLTSDGFEDLDADNFDDPLSYNQDDAIVNSTSLNENENLSSEFTDFNEELIDEDDSNIIDIFLSDVLTNNVDNIDKKEKKAYMKFIIPAFMVVFIVAVGFFIIKSLFANSEPTSSNKVEQENNIGKIDNNKPDNDNNKEENPSNEDKPNTRPENDDHKLYFNDELISKIGYKDKIASVSTDVYNTGNSSLLVENDSTESTKILFAVIDFTNEKLSHMLNDTVAISAKFKAYKDLDAKLIVEVYKNNKIVTNASAKISIQNDIWIPKNITVGTENIDRVNLYLEFTGENKVWIDNISVDVMK